MADHTLLPLGRGGTEDDRPISPPPLKRRRTEPASRQQSPAFVASPFRLTAIRDLPPSKNVDAVSLHDLLGDPCLAEIWLFDFLFDVDFVMQHIDPQIREKVNVKIVHGSWKREDENRIYIEQAKSRWKNVHAIAAYMPEPFGCHHTKMMILFRSDNKAKIVIHTANMIPRDWANFTQAVWQSPELIKAQQDPTDSMKGSKALSLGSGQRFKRDLLRYIGFYGTKRTGSLHEKLQSYDFSAVRAALIASVPTKVRLKDVDGESRTAWGWPGLRDSLRRIQCLETSTVDPQIVVEMSSIGTLPVEWITHFEQVIGYRISPRTPQPKIKYMFPTADEIRRSLDGYEAGASIHFRVQSDRQQKTLDRLRPSFVHWAGDALDEMPATETDSTPRGAGRRRAAPHIKTYIRFTSSKMDRIDWALLSSANLSQQAWGSMPKNDEVRICSYELGVLVWPELLADQVSVDQDTSHSAMVPVFGKDIPIADDIPESIESGYRQVIGIRMPYDVPLVPYRSEDQPWVGTQSHGEPDWKGQTWGAHD